jgi:shikimate dehydrogenase
MTVNSLDHYAVFGNPIAHSKSPMLQTAFAEQTQQNIFYDAQCVEHFSVAAKDFFAQGGKGLNITVPFKEDAFQFADRLTDRAKRAGAVNTLFLDKNNNVVGDTTDGVGMVSDIKTNLGWGIQQKNILLLGAGGAVRGVIEPLINEQPFSITIANRTVEKATTLADNFSDLFSIDACSFTELKGSLFDIIINGTSASLSGEIPPLPEAIFHKGSCCYDMMYNQELTPFLKWSKQKGAGQVSDGLGMLVCQGAESFFIWRGVKPDTLPVIELLRKQL